MAMDGIDEIGTFANHGFSEIGWFRLLENCPPPMSVRGEATGNRQMTIRWQPYHQHQAFIVQHRVYSSQGEDVFPWHSVEVRGYETTISGLRPEWTYLYRVGALCGMMREPVFADIGRVTLPLYCPERLARCGNPAPVEITNWEPLEHDLRPGDVIFTGGGRRTTVLYATSLGNGWFEGRGVAALGWIFEEAEFYTRFDRLRLNTDFQQIDGTSHFVFDRERAQIADLNVLDYGGQRSTQGAVVFETIQLNFTVPPIPEMTYNPETGELTILDINSVPHIVQVPSNEQGEPTFPIILECAEGQRFKVELPEGSEEDIAAGRTITPTVTPIRDLTPGSFNTAALDEDAGIVVRFSRGDGRFGFDYGKEEWFQTSTLLRLGFYEPWGRGYVAPWKLIPTGETDVVEARIDIGSADPNNIFFVLTDGTGVPARKDNDRWILSLPGTGHNQRYEVFAIYRQGNQNLSVGKLRVISYRQQSHTVTLVNVNARVEETERARIERELNEIYNQYGVTFTVRVDSSIYGNTDWDIDQDGRLNVSGSGFFTRETDEMRALRHVFQDEGDYVHGEYYIFILQEAYARGEPDWAVMGDMPRGQHFGFVFRNAVREDEMSRLIAHELGHGIFTLRHTFDREYGAAQGSTNNLMDYGQGTELAAFQWNVMSYPAWITRFDSEEEGRLVGVPGKTNTDLVNEIVQKLRCAYARNARRIHTALPLNAWRVSLSDSGIDIDITPYFERSGLSRYTEFTLRENWWESRVQMGNSHDFRVADDLRIRVHGNQADEFVRFIQNNDFSPDIRRIEEIVGRGEPILPLVLNTSYCVMQGLNTDARLALIDELANRGGRLSEAHGNLLLNLIRSTSSSGVPRETQQAVLVRITSPHIFARFLRDINPMIGRNSRDEFIIQLSRLYREVFDARYEQIDRSMSNITDVDMFRRAGENVLKYGWRSNLGGRISRNLNNLYLFSTDPNYRNYNFLVVPTGSRLGNWVVSPNRGYEVHPLTTVYVFIDRDSSFADRGIILRMPAFQLAHLLDLEQSRLQARAINIVASVATIGIGATRFAAANIWNRLLFAYSSGISILDIFDVNYQQYLRESHERGEDFVLALNAVNAILATRSAVGGAHQLTTGDMQLIETLFEQWGLLYLTLETSQNARSNEIRREMERLRLNLDEVIF